MPGVVAPNPRTPAPEPPGVFIIEDGKGVDLGGGVEGAFWRRGCAGEGEAARNMSRSAPSSLLGGFRDCSPWLKGLLCSRAERTGSGDGVRGTRGGEERISGAWNERVGRSSSSSSE